MSTDFLDVGYDGDGDDDDDDDDDVDAAGRCLRHKFSFENKTFANRERETLATDAKENILYENSY